MTTSGTTSFNPDILDIIEEAYEMMGIEVRSGYDLKTARRSLDLLMHEWGNRGINMWTLASISVLVESGTNDVVLPVNVIDVLDAMWRTGDDLGQHDQTMTRLGGSQYAQMSNKNEVGTPSQFYVWRTSPPKVRLWPTPDAQGTFVIWGLRTIHDSGVYTNTMDVPPRFLPALVSGLAYQLALKSPAAMQRVPMLQTEYERQWTLAAEEDRDRSSFFMVPDLSSYNR